MANGARFGRNRVCYLPSRPHVHEISELVVERKIGQARDGRKDLGSWLQSMVLVGALRFTMHTCTSYCGSINAGLAKAVHNFSFDLHYFYTMDRLFARNATNIVIKICWPGGKFETNLTQ